jgi:Bacterial regulatory helix-turn-helix protein, lysR family
VDKLLPVTAVFCVQFEMPASAPLTASGQRIARETLGRQGTAASHELAACVTRVCNISCPNDLLLNPGNAKGQLLMPSTTLRRVSLRQIDLFTLTCLYALVQEKSVTTAAALVGISQPALIRILNGMRRAFGDLFWLAGRTPSFRRRAARSWPRSPIRFSN